MKVKIRTSRSEKDFSGAMTDISFLLIIFFLVTTVFMTTVFMTTQGILLKLPSPETEPQRLHLDEIILIEMLGSDKFMINKKFTVSQEELAGQIKAGLQTLSDPVLVLMVTGDVSYEEVLNILEISKEAGVSSFSIQYKESKPRGLRLEEKT
ncbi:MAG: biopolymer transporter ExbD [Spirochaetales bacterium]|nr:biopolymer transporter ExbD [Spirochaetales bacterium]